jgi:hypothetical protein
LSSNPLLSDWQTPGVLQCESIVKPYRHVEIAIRKSMCLAGYPKKYISRLHSRHKQDQPILLLSRVLGPRLKLDSKPHTWGPTSKWCLDLHLSLPPINQSRKSRSPWKESNKPSRSHKQVCAQDNKSMTWLGFMQWTVVDEMWSAAYWGVYP